MVMGTASTMAAMVEALGVGLPGNIAFPAVDARRNVIARDAGRRIVQMVKDDVRLSSLLTRKAFENAIRVNAAVGGSTNAVIHLIAVARRIGVKLDLEDWDQLGRGVHTLVNLMPNGEFLMEDFCYAGGLPVVIRELGQQGLLNKEAITANGRTIWDNCKEARNDNPAVIMPFKKPFKRDTGIAVLRGNLCPDGAIIKPSAATPKLMKHKGRAVVFESIEDFHARVEKLDLDASAVMVLKNCGPKGYPGMAEVGNMGLPPKLLQQGVTDMVRISDARMSGTAYGTVVLHVTPEAAVGGPLALVRDGDMIAMDVDARTLHLEVADQELAKRRSAWRKPELPVAGGYVQLYVDHVEQADTGADFDFLIGCRGDRIGRESH
jgi:dihydroxy-acid dehydratase